jgi:RimJ/RimL family protein N-acetyltransferase
VEPVQIPIAEPPLLLRGFRRTDLGDLVAGYNDPQSRRFLPQAPSPFTRADGEWYLRAFAPAAFAEGGAAYAIADPATDRLLGGIGVSGVQPIRGQAEIGYWVGPWARGRGIATAAVRALTAHAFDNGLARMELLTHWENTTSQRVALASGYRREGVRRAALPDRDGGRDDLLAYARVLGDPPEPPPRALPDLPGGELTDGIVTLRPLIRDDLAFYAELHDVPDVIATSVPPQRRDAAEIRRRISRAAANWIAGERADLVILDTATGQPAGEIGLFYQEPFLAQAMIGYSMLPGWRGRGYPTRAAQLVALWAFAETGIIRLVAGTLPTNVGSQRVLEKAGFRREAYLRARVPGVGGTRNDDVQYVLLAEDMLDRLAPGGGQAVDSSDRMP